MQGMGTRRLGVGMPRLRVPADDPADDRQGFQVHSLPSTLDLFSGYAPTRSDNSGRQHRHGYKGMLSANLRDMSMGDLEGAVGTRGSPNTLDQNSGSVDISCGEADALVGDQALDWDGLTKKLRRESREGEKIIPSVGSHFCDDSQGGFGFPRTNKDRGEGDGHDSAGQLTGPKGTPSSTSSTGGSAELRGQ